MAGFKEPDFVPVGMDPVLLSTIIQMEVKSCAIILPPLGIRWGPLEARKKNLDRPKNMNSSSSWDERGANVFWNRGR